MWVCVCGGGGGALKSSKTFKKSGCLKLLEIQKFKKIKNG